MNLLALLICAIGVPLVGSLQAADASAGVGENRRGAIHGTVYWLGDHRSRDIPVYLFDLQQSAPLRKLVRDTQSRLRSLGQANPMTVNIEIEFFDKVAELVPRLRRIAKVRTDLAGTYRFSDVSSGRRYYVVSVDVTEDGVFYGATLTPVLEPGRRLRTDVRRINLWYAE